MKRCQVDHPHNTWWWLPWTKLFVQVKWKRERFNICSMAIKYTILSICTRVEETSDGRKQTNFSVPQYLLCVNVVCGHPTTTNQPNTPSARKYQYNNNYNEIMQMSEIEEARWSNCYRRKQFKARQQHPHQSPPSTIMPKTSINVPL